MDPWDPTDRDLAIRTIIGESGGDYERQKAVANVIRNRIQTGRWGNRPRDVVLAEGQFEPWQTRRSELLSYAPEDPAYVSAGRALDMSAYGDVTGGATHFYGPEAQRALGRKPPPWAVGAPMAQVGGHDFYAPEGRVQVAQAGGTDWNAVVMGTASPRTAPNPPLGAAAAAAAPGPAQPRPAGSGTDWNAVVTGQQPVPQAQPLPPPPGPPLNTTIGGPPPAPAPGPPLSLAPPGRSIAPGRMQEPEAGALPAPFPDQPPPQGYGDAKVSIDTGSYPMNIARQAALGATMNTGDWIGSNLMALRAVFTDEEIGQLAEELYRQNRERDRTFAAQNPKAAGAAQFGGAVATAPLMPSLAPARVAGQVPSFASRAVPSMAEGAGLGVVSGFAGGEGDAGQRANQAAMEGAFGNVTGLAGPVVGSLARGAYNAVRAPFRGAVGTDTEAARRIGGAFREDDADIGAAQRALEMGRQEDIPLIVADTGGTTVRSLARSAANTSTPGREALNRATQDRWLGQSRRARRIVQAITGSSGDSEDVLRNLKRAADATNAPAYRRAYSAPSAQSVWTPELQQLATSPAFTDAMRAAERIGRDDAALRGFPPVINPFQFRDGVAYLRPGAAPNLQYWDYVHRALRFAGEAQMKKSPSRAEQFFELDSALKDHLDIMIPEYGQARAGAAAFFGARDAGEAGIKGVNIAMERDQFNRGFNAMTPQEQAYFRETFGNELLRQIEASKDRINVTNTIFESLKASERIETVFGPQSARRIEALVRIENIMNEMKHFVSGGSDTAQKLRELGLAGGGAGASEYLGQDYSTSGMIALALGGGSRFIDKRVSRRVAEMMASNDPATLQRVADLMARNDRIMAAVRQAERVLGTRGGTLAPQVKQQEPQ